MIYKHERLVLKAGQAFRVYCHTGMPSHIVTSSWHTKNVILNKTIEIQYTYDLYAGLFSVSVWLPYLNKLFCTPRNLRSYFSRLARVFTWSEALNGCFLRGSQQLHLLYF